MPAGPSASRLLGCSQPYLWSRWGQHVWAVLSSQLPAYHFSHLWGKALGREAVGRDEGREWEGASLCLVSPQLTGNRCPRC